MEQSTSRVRRLLCALGLIGGLALAWMAQPVSPALALGPCANPQDSTQIITPYAGPGRSPDSLAILLREADPHPFLRTGFDLSLHGPDGTAIAHWGLEDLVSETEPVTGARLLTGGFDLGLAAPEEFRLVLTETWDDLTADYNSVGCQITQEVDLLAGGPLPPARPPQLWVVASIGTHSAHRLSRRIGYLGLDTRLTLTATAECRVSDDGYGHAIVRAQTVDLSPFHGFDQSWSACTAAPSNLPVGAIQPVTRRFSLPFPLSVHRGGGRTLAWRLAPESGGRGASGHVRIRYSDFTPDRYRTIWDYQFDPYINICINGNHNLYASGGHLYCTVQTSVYSSLATVTLTR